MSDRIAIADYVVIKSLLSIGYTMFQVENYLATATQPTKGYYYADEMPIK